MHGAGHWLLRAYSVQRMQVWPRSTGAREFCSLTTAAASCILRLTHSRHSWRFESTVPRFWKSSKCMWMVVSGTVPTCSRQSVSVQQGLELEGRSSMLSLHTGRRALKDASIVSTKSRRCNKIILSKGTSFGRGTRDSNETGRFDLPRPSAPRYGQS
jgi:hypothetical protein